MHTLHIPAQTCNHVSFIWTACSSSSPETEGSVIFSRMCNHESVDTANERTATEAEAIAKEAKVRV